MIEILLCANLAAVDGDTVKCDGAPFVSGYDAPEVGKRAGCERERALGRMAKQRMAELIRTPGLVIEDSGHVDRYDRPLVVLRLPDGRTIGSVLQAEGLAVEWWPGADFDWC